jgi:hypothetical protein
VFGLALIAYAANELSTNLKGFFAQALPIASLRARKHLEDFLARDSSLHALSGFGVALQMVDGHFRFVPRT